jgi:hypothetical protein
VENSKEQRNQKNIGFLLQEQKSKAREIDGMIQNRPHVKKTLSSLQHSCDHFGLLICSDIPLRCVQEVVRVNNLCSTSTIPFQSDSPMAFPFSGVNATESLLTPLAF